MGYTGNNGALDTSYQRSSDSRTATSATPDSGSAAGFRGGSTSGASSANFDLSMDAINSYNQGTPTAATPCKAAKR